MDSPTVDELITEFERVHDDLLATLARLKGMIGRWRAGDVRPVDRDDAVECVSWLEEVIAPHEVDEEMSLMPRLTENQPALFARLAEEHHALQLTVTSLRSQLRRALREEALPAAATDLERVLSELTAGYEEHFALEDEHVFAVARQTLDVDAVREINAEMGARRSQ